MAYKISDKLTDPTRIDPKIGKPPPMATSLPRVVAINEDGSQRLGDERIFMAGDPVPDEYVSDTLRERLKDKDDPIHKTIEVVGDSEGSSYNSLSTADLDTELAARGLSVDEGSGKDGKVVKDDKVAALEQSDAQSAVEGQKMASGAPATTFVAPAPASTSNPFTSE